MWDVENGRHITKFGDTHGKGNKLTSGCFDKTQRRMVSAGSDGSVKIWNFSNGSSLKNLVIDHDAKIIKVDKEVTSLLCVFAPDPPKDDKKKENEKEDEKPSYFVAAGWDRRLRIWLDDRESDEENVNVARDLPNKYLQNSSSHNDDIMSAIYDAGTNQIFTGAHDGTILAWHFETGFIKV